jgi:hypothetical protein
MAKENRKKREKHSTIRVGYRTLNSLNKLKKKGRFVSMDQLVGFFLYLLDTRIQEQFQAVVEEYFERMEPEEEVEEKEITKINLQDPSPAEELLENLGGKIDQRNDNDL